MAELSVFVDESGDFGEVSAHSPYYIVSLVLHDQMRPIAGQVERFRQKIQVENLEGGLPVHTAPLIRREKPYEYTDAASRRHLFDALFAFSRRCDIKHKCFVIDKRRFGCGHDLEERIARELGQYVRDNIEYFQSFDKVIVYYDKGQKEISRTLRVSFAASLSHVEHRLVAPVDYMLFQVADLCCTMELVEAGRLERGLTRSESVFFGGAASFKKTYLKAYKRQEF